MTNEKPTFNYTGHGFERKNYEATKHLSYKELNKLIRKNLKNEFPKCKFSVNRSNGRIKIILVSAPFNVFGEINDNICELQARRISRFTKAEDIKNKWKNEIKEGNHEMNQYYINDDYIITPEAKELFKKVNTIINSYNFDDSDSQIDYFHTNFYYTLSIGKYGKPFIKIN